MKDLEEENVIKAYVKQILKIQQQNRPPSNEDLEQIANDLGLTDNDVAMIRNRFKDYLTRGQGYSRYEDWESAIEELEQAVMLNPAHVEALYSLANAHKHRYLLSRNKNDLQKAKTYAKRVLELNPAHDPSLRLISQINKGNPIYAQKTRKQKSSALQQLNAPNGMAVQNLDNKLAPTSKHLRKSLTDRKISGVCAGIAEYFRIDPSVVRIGFVLGTLLTSGTVFIPLYVLLALIMPKK